MEQYKLNKGKLLDENGNLNEAGYAFELVKEYNRKDIKAKKGRIKEWDYYYINDTHYGIALTIDDNSYMGLVSVSILDFDNKTDITKSYMNWFTYGKTNLPSTSVTGDLIANGKKYNMAFYNDNGHRRLVVDFKDLAKGKDFKCDIKLELSSKNSMVIATPFEKDKHFYYNQKINNLIGSGWFEYDGKHYDFDETKTLGVLDWGRGVWTYKNTWYWSSLNGYYNGRKIGFNLGYGFGDTRKASENMLFVDDKVYKLNDVVFDIPLDEKNKDLFLQPWKLYSATKDIDLEFKPIIDRASNTNALIIQSDQHQVFGYFSGSFKVNDEIIEIKDMIGFAEKVMNRW